MESSSTGPLKDASKGSGTSAAATEGKEERGPGRYIVLEQTGKDPSVGREFAEVGTFTGNGQTDVLEQALKRIRGRDGQEGAVPQLVAIAERLFKVRGPKEEVTRRVSWDD